MKLIGLGKIDDFGDKHTDAKDPLAAWVYEVKDASWDSPLDVKNRYPSASLINGKRFVFNIKGNHHRLDAKIDYERKLVIVVRIGTHAEYDKWTF